MAASGVSASSECVSLFNELKLGKQVKWIIYALSDNGKEIVVEESSKEENYEAFREKLLAAQTAGKPGPRYAVYDFQYEAQGGEGKRNKIVFVAWSPEGAGIRPKMVYSSSKDALKRSLNGIAVEIQANDEDDIEYESVLARCRGR